MKKLNSFLKILISSAILVLGSATAYAVDVVPVGGMESEWAAAETFELSADKNELQIGEHLIVTFSTSFPGLVGLVLDINFDETMFQFESFDGIYDVFSEYSFATDGGGDGMLLMQDLGKVSILLERGEEQQDTKKGGLFSVTFTALKNGSSSIDISNLYAVDYDIKEIDAETSYSVDLTVSDVDETTTSDVDETTTTSDVDETTTSDVDETTTTSDVDETTTTSDVDETTTTSDVDETTTAGEIVGKKGDLNDDDNVNTTDLTILKRVAAKWSEYPSVDYIQSGDIDKDSKIGTSDLTLLKRSIAKWGEFLDLDAYYNSL